MTNAERRPRPILSLRHIALLASVAVGVFALDQAIKQLVVTTMVEGERIEVLGGLLQWHFVRNPGAAFSMASGMTWVFSIVAAVVVVVILVVSRRIRSTWWAAVLGAVLGGTLGNLFDRLFREPSFGEGHVVDFISTPWLMPAIYNIADIAIVGGMAAFVLITLLDIRLDGTRGRKDAPRELVADETETGEIRIVTDGSKTYVTESTEANDEPERQP
ncbi:signal peptidase II [Gulosibacter macacae]|uniref:signal peptidase II n=1 Tax=Gulosibacter macacae TaxID=2488791 RepID=UPI001F474A2E|nr:signal peptidase II [Gulosibacter macacae]